MCILEGTNTDGVLIDVSRVLEPNRGVLAHFKAPTTPNVSDGIEVAIQELLNAADVTPSSVSCVSIGTTAFINAVLEQDARRLSKVAVIRICGPYTRQCPPFIDFPTALKTLINGHVGYVDGGLESTSIIPGCLTIDVHRNISVDGREIVSMKESEIIEQCKLTKTKGLKNVSYG
jgi:N-methylhydantoinase A/oxoprolinase/acetone carboxylase beta subunit